MPYAEIGASLSTIAILVYCCGGGCFVCCFEFGCIRNIVSCQRCHILKLELATFPGELVELCLVGLELATSTSITGDVTTNPTMNLTYITYITYK